MFELTREVQQEIWSNIFILICQFFETDAKDAPHTLEESDNDSQTVEELLDDFNPTLEEKLGRDFDLSERSFKRRNQTKREFLLEFKRAVNNTDVNPDELIRLRDHYLNTSYTRKSLLSLMIALYPVFTEMLDNMGYVKRDLFG